MDALPKIGFGGMPLSIKGRPPEDVARRVLNAAIDAGMTLIDTADVYCLDDDDIGHNERLIASIGQRDKIRVATKGGLARPGGAWVNAGNPQQIRAACERSLRALQTERIWLYQFHAPDLKVPFEKSIEAFAELHREGKFEHFGLSNVSIEQLDRAARILPVASVQNRLSPYARESVPIAQECARRNILFLAYSPLGGSRLAKKLHELAPLRRIAETRGISVQQVAIAWTRAQAATVVPIPGARSVEHAVDCAQAAGLDLTSDELNLLYSSRGGI
ncbi:MAG: aldo/keto reductase [Acidobacteria bacterium]|nr:MAG: aldo/keto reductase [Acidobacteriota bacterium]